MYQAYENIFARAGIKPIVVKSDTGIMGGKIAHEFMLESGYGEDYLIISQDGSYSANQEIAEFHRVHAKSDPLPLEKAATPGKKTIEEVSAFMGVRPDQTMKAVLFETEQDKKRCLVLGLIRGDLEISEVKLRNYLKVPCLLPAQDDFIRSFGSRSGIRFPHRHRRAQGPACPGRPIRQRREQPGGRRQRRRLPLQACQFPPGLPARRIAAISPKRRKATCPRTASPCCALCAASKSATSSNWAPSSPSPWAAPILDEDGKQQTPTMGCYGIGVGRLMAAAVENSHDEFGPIWPKELAPFHVHLLNIGREPEVMEACAKLVAEWEGLGLEVLFDDRDERPGVKFKDADLWGIPIRIAVGKKGIAEDGLAEWKPRKDKEFTKVPLRGPGPEVAGFLQVLSLGSHSGSFESRTAGKG